MVPAIYPKPGTAAFSSRFRLLYRLEPAYSVEKLGVDSLVSEAISGGLTGWFGGSR